MYTYRSLLELKNRKIKTISREEKKTLAVFPPGFLVLLFPLAQLLLSVAQSKPGGRRAHQTASCLPNARGEAPHGPLARQKSASIRGNSCVPAQHTRFRPRCEYRLPQVSNPNSWMTCIGG